MFRFNFQLSPRKFSTSTELGPEIESKYEAHHGAKPPYRVIDQFNAMSRELYHVALGIHYI